MRAAVFDWPTNGQSGHVTGTRSTHDRVGLAWRGDSNNVLQNTDTNDFIDISVLYFFFSAMYYSIVSFALFSSPTFPFTVNYENIDKAHI